MNITIRPLEESDLPEADRIFRIAFGTFLGLPDPVAYPDLDLGGEIDAVRAQGLGETVLIHDGDDLVAFAICHIGPGSEAGSNVTYLKFAAAKPGSEAPSRLTRLLGACEGLAASRGLGRVMAGVNTSRDAAYRLLIDHGFRGVMNGVTMHRGADLGYSRPDCFVLDDWR